MIGKLNIRAMSQSMIITSEATRKERGSVLCELLFDGVGFPAFVVGSTPGLLLDEGAEHTIPTPF
jgi:hypothetical protein